LCYSNILVKNNDIPRVALKESDDYLMTKFSDEWNKEKEKESPLLVRSVIKLIWVDFFSAGFLKFAQSMT
jgi:hypothetical protein